MAKVLFSPTSGELKGKVAEGVYQKGRNGYILRKKVIPSNPKTSYQINIRALFTQIAKAWVLLSTANIVAWNLAAGLIRKNSKKKSFGQKTALSGKAYFTEINGNRKNVGLEISDAPPLPGDVEQNNPVSLTYDLTADTATLEYSANPTKTSYVLLLLTPTLSAGVRFYKGKYKSLGAIQLSTTSKSYDVKNLIVRRFGALPALSANIACQVKNVSTTGFTGEVVDVPIIRS